MTAANRRARPDRTGRYARDAHDDATGDDDDDATGDDDDATGDDDDDDATGDDDDDEPLPSLPIRTIGERRAESDFVSPFEDPPELHDVPADFRARIEAATPSVYEIAAHAWDFDPAVERALLFLDREVHLGRRLLRAWPSPDGTVLDIWYCDRHDPSDDNPGITHESAYAYAVETDLPRGAVHLEPPCDE